MRLGMKGAVALLALTAILFVPPRIIRHRACCYADPEAIPGRTCCGQPLVDPNEESLLEHRPCCEPLVFEKSNTDTPAVPLTVATNGSAAVNSATEPRDSNASVALQDILLPAYPTGPPLGRALLVLHVRLNT
jgi:hypothetical protein